MSSFSGAQAKAYGQLFEKMFDARCQSMGITATRFPEGCRRIGLKTLIQVKTPWDWILSYNGKVAFIDTKTTSHDTFPHSAIVDHQVVEMLHHEISGNGRIAAGYVVWLRPKDTVFYVASSVLEGLLKVRGSISLQNKNIIVLGQTHIFDPLGML